MSKIKQTVKNKIKSVLSEENIELVKFFNSL